jgi:hypothetical protein
MARQDWAKDYLQHFDQVLAELSLPSSKMKSDHGLGLKAHQQYEFGDLHVSLKDRILIVEVDVGGAACVYNLCKYWPLARLLSSTNNSEGDCRPILIIYALAKSSADDFICHSNVFAFLSDRIREDADVKPRMLNIKLFTFEDHRKIADGVIPDGLKPAIQAFRAAIEAETVDEAIDKIFV